MWAGHRAREKGERAYHLSGDCRRGLFLPAGRCCWWRGEAPLPRFHPQSHPQPLSPRLSAVASTHVHMQQQPFPSNTQSGVWLEAADLCPPKPWKPAQQLHHWPLCPVCPPLYLAYKWTHSNTWTHHILIPGRAPICILDFIAVWPLWALVSHCQFMDRLALTPKVHS